MISLSVSKEDQGTAISFAHASRSSIGLVSPILGGVLFERTGIPGTAFLVVLCAASTAGYAVLFAAQSLEQISQKFKAQAKNK